MTKHKDNPVRTVNIVFVLFLTMLVSLVFHLIPAGSQAQQTDEEIAKQFFPQRLIDESAQDFAQGGPEPTQFLDFKVADLNGVGTNDFIVAAYTNGFSGAIRVLRKQGNTASIVSEPNLRLLSGIIPKVQLLDLDKDGRPEIIVSYSSARGPAADWVFKWNGTALNLIGPSVTDANGDVSTVLSEADFIDLNGDGILEIINPPQDSPGTFDVFTLDGNRLKSLNFFGVYIRGKATPLVTTRTFSLVKTDISYLVKAINGDSNGNNRVSSAVITLNGKVVIGPEAFNQKVSQAVTQVTLQSSNTVNVELKSAPASQIILTIEEQVP
jgi:hypothetical protein